MHDWNYFFLKSRAVWYLGKFLLRRSCGALTFWALQWSCAMSDLTSYLARKREAVLARQDRIQNGDLGPTPIRAAVSAEGGSGIRRIRIRDFQIISDSPRDFAGYDLGPGSPELQLGILGSCLNHSFLIQAAALNVPLEALDVEVTGIFDQRAGSPGYEDSPVYPHNIEFTVRLTSSASDEDVNRLWRQVERSCPILNLLKQPQSITGRIERLTSPHARAAE
jgi:uncharacterized OsmC-like protein